MRHSIGTALILCLASLLLPLGAAERVALVIGVDQYDNLPDSAQLRVAVSDARVLAKTLKELPEPFAVELLENADREAVVGAFDRFVGEAKQAECAIVYFAGHGIEFHGENYLLLSDTEIDAVPDEAVRRVKDRFYYETLAMRKVLEDLDETEAGLKLVILDACRNNPIDLEGPGGTRSLVGAQGGLGRVTAPSGMLISYSADAGEEANDGLFTGVLSRHLAMPGRTLMEVFAMTRSEVREKAEALAAEGRGVRHEPAEYSKLDPAALSFTFVPGERPDSPFDPEMQPRPANWTAPGINPPGWKPNGSSAGGASTTTVPTKPGWTAPSNSGGLSGTMAPPTASMGGGSTSGVSGIPWNPKERPNWTGNSGDPEALREHKIMEAQVALAEVNAKMESERQRYREALNVINTLTDNKRRPVVQNSPQYHQCLAASKVIQAIETGAPSLKAEKTRLESVLSALGSPASSEGESTKNPSE